MTQFQYQKQKKKEKAILIGIATRKTPPKIAKEHLAELGRLVDTASAEIVESIFQKINQYNSSTLIGAGKLEEIRQLCLVHKADLIVFDDDLSGSQVKNIEKIIPNIKIMDRSGIILDIFAKHARTSESKIMVEIAQLEYLAPRLTRMWTHLSRQKGGGVGMTGPGETQLETDKRLITNRISLLKKKLKKIEKNREVQAKNRNSQFHVGVVGYTNAGKSTLTRRFTKAEILVEDKLFATLDSTSRKFFLEPGKSIILSDTVGFIRKLPHNLVASFRSTLGIVSQSDLILQVVDVSAPDFKDHMEVTNSVLKDLVEEEVNRLLVFNKTDRLDEAEREKALSLFPDAIFISATESIGLELLKSKLVENYDTWDAKLFDPKTNEKVDEIEEYDWPPLEEDEA